MIQKRKEKEISNSIITMLKRAFEHNIEVTISISKKGYLDGSLKCLIRNINIEENFIEVVANSKTEVIECLLQINWIQGVILKQSNENYLQNVI